MLPLLSACDGRPPNLTWDDALPLMSVAVTIGVAIGLWLGKLAESSVWRSKGECPPSGGGRMLSKGRFYWVCAEDADEGARRFVAQTLVDHYPKKSAREEFVEALGGQDAVNRMAEQWIHNEECPKCCSRVDEGPLKPGTNAEMRTCEYCGHAWEWEPLP